MLGEERLAEPRDRLGPGDIRARDEPAQAPIADRVAGEQHEVRAALPLADPAQVLLDRLAMARQAGAGRAGPARAGPRSRRGRGLPAWSACRPRGAVVGRRAGTTMPSGSGDRRIQQLDLDPDDRTEPGRLGRR